MAIASSRSASTGLVIGCIIFGLGSLIVAHVDVGGWAMSFWRYPEPVSTVTPLPGRPSGEAPPERS